VPQRPGEANLPRGPLTGLDRVESRKRLADGVDPSQNRKATKTASLDRASNSFEVVAREWFAKFSTEWAPSHKDRIVRLFERDIFPWIGGTPVSEVSAPDLLAVLRRIEGRGALDTAHRARGMCGQMLRYAVATGRALRDPSADLRGALPPVKEEHFAVTTEPAKFAEILIAMDGYDGMLIVRTALRLALLVFVRPGELRKAEWKDFDLKAAEWRYMVTKTKTPHIVPLSR
jgi:integrase